MSAAHCPGCGARHRAIRYSDDPNTKALGHRITHKIDCTVLAARRKRFEEIDRERASRRTGADQAAAPNPAPAHEAGSAAPGIEPPKRRLEVSDSAAAGASRQSRGTVAAEQLKADAGRPLSIHKPTEEAA